MEFVIGAIVGTLVGCAVFALLSANKNTVVMCDWDNCKHCDEDGFCKHGYVELADVTDDYATDDYESIIVCKSFEWREEK